MELGQVFTKEKIANYMMGLFDLPKDSAILDPCFGEGAFLKAAISCGYNNISGFEIDTELYNKTIPQYPNLTLFNGDFLDANNNESFDGIIMNPPYLRHEKINDLIELGISKEVLQEQDIYKELPSQSNLYMYFTLKAISLLKSGGELVIIFPSSWQQALTGDKFKDLLNNSCTLIKEIHITGDLFEKHAFVEVVILHLKKGFYNIKQTVKYVEVQNDEFIQQNLNTINLNELAFNGSFSDLGTVQRGITTGYNKMFINPSFKQEESLLHVKNIISTPKSVTGYNSEGARLDTIFILNQNAQINSEVKEYIELWKEKILNEKKPKTLYNKILNGNESWFMLREIDSQGILFSYFVRNDMKFILNNKGYLARDNFYIIRPKIDTYLAFALLNNYYTFAQLELLGKLYGAGLLKLQRYDLEMLLMPEINSIIEADVRELIILAKLAINGDFILNIEKITKLLEKYANISFDSIKNIYNIAKKERLENGK